LKRPAFVCALALAVAGLAVHLWLGAGTAGLRPALAQATAPAASEWSRLAGPPAYPSPNPPDAPLSRSDLARAVGVVGDLGFFFSKLADTDPNPLAGQVWRAAGKAYTASEGEFQAALQQGRMRVSDEASDQAVQHRGNTFVVAPRLAGDWAPPAAAEPEGREDGWTAAANLASHLIGAWVEGDPARSTTWFARHETAAGLGAGAGAAEGRPRRADLARYWALKDLFLRASLLRAATESPGQRGLWSIRESQIETRLSVFLDRLATDAGADWTARLRADWAAYRADTARLASERVWLLLAKRRPEPAVSEATAEPKADPQLEPQPEPQPEPVTLETIAAAAATAPNAPEETGASADEIAAVEQVARAEAVALEAEIDRLQQALDERERGTSLLSAQLAAAERSAEAAWQEADAAAAETEQARQRTLQLETERDEAQTVAQGEAADLRTQTETLSRELETVRAEATAARQAAVLAEAERQAARDRSAGLTQELAATESARATAEAAAALAQQDAEAARAESRELHETLARMAADLSRLQADADTAATAQDTRAVEAAALQSELAALRNELTALRTTAEAADAAAAEQIRALHQDLSAKDDALARLQQDLAARDTAEQPVFLERWQELLAAAVILIGLPLVFLAFWIGRTRAAERVPAGLPVQPTPASPAAPQPSPMTAAPPVVTSGDGAEHRPPPATVDLLAEALRNSDWAHADRCFAALTGLKSPRLRQLLSDASSEDLAMVCRAAGLDRLTFANLYLTSRNGAQGGAMADPKALSDAVRLFDDTDQDVAQARLAARQNGEPEADSRS
jgi:hypothetical protein